MADHEFFDGSEEYGPQVHEVFVECVGKHIKIRELTGYEVSKHQTSAIKSMDKDGDVEINLESIPSAGPRLIAACCLKPDGKTKIWKEEQARNIRKDLSQELVEHINRINEMGPYDPNNPDNPDKKKTEDD